MGDLCLAVGNLTDALAYYRTALAEAPVEDENGRLEIVLKVSACLRRQGKSGDALAFIDGFVSAFTAGLRRDLLAERAMLLCLVGRYGEAAGVCDEVQREESISERGKDASIYLVLGHVLSRLCRWKQAIVCLEQAATFARMCNDLGTLGNALNNLGIVYKNLCRFSDAARCLRRAVQVARHTHDDASLAVRLLNLASTLLKQGQTSAAAAALAECSRVSSLLGLKRTACFASISTARVERVRGNLKEAERLLRKARAEAADIDEPRVQLLAEETLGEVLCEMDEPAEAQQVLEECLANLPAESKDIEAEVKSRLGEVYRTLGMTSRARQCAAEALRVARSTGDLYEAGRCLRLLAMLARDPRDGRRHLLRARRIFRATGARLERGLALCLMAELEGTPAPSAARLLEDAIAIFASCGAIGMRARALSSLAMVRLGIGQHEKALAALVEAEKRAAGSAALARTVAETRLKVDQAISRRLAAAEPLAVYSFQDAFQLFKLKLGADGLVLARVTEDHAVQVVRACGVDFETAERIASFAGPCDQGPFVSTNFLNVVGPSKTRRCPRALIGVSLGRTYPRALCLVCWDGRLETAKVGAGTSGLLGAHYEILRLAAVLEKALNGDAPPTMPIAFGGLLTSDPRLKAILTTLPRIAATRANVLVVGETGTGKELIARALHALSPRHTKQLVVQNCAALPEHLLESELFGHKAGAFTDARTDKRGLLEVASGGTFFLDEIGDISPAIQAKMLRAIECGEIRRLGDTLARPVDVRFISATNKCLEREIEAGRFRRDLFYRLNVVSLALPPLRTRPDDVSLLARFFLARMARAHGRPGLELDGGALAALMAYPWPGNVRQLENEIERAVVILGSRPRVTSDVLSPCVLGLAEPGQGVPSLRDEVRAVERSRILAALAASNWNKTRAAKLLGDISRPALVAKMKRLGIPPLRPREAPLAGLS
ncbi:MAG TPA: sigma 54-interacting transcriptional regulator [bacterium]|nr:sigma 54-interacting transcriptional regulator [bacterium]